MKRMMVAMLGAVVISAVGVYAQAKPAEGSTFYGCIVPGANAESFSLVSATEKGQKGKEKVTFNVTPESKKIDFSTFVTKGVEVQGTVSGTGSKATLTVSKIKWRSDYCA